MRRELLLALALSACARPVPPAPAPSVHYMIGAPYQAAGVWHYPRESFQLDETGLAERLPARAGLTADGEAFDPAAMTGAHPTLQLPAIALVTQLETGRQVEIRLNDRGPPHPGRVVGLTPAAADLLGLPAQGAAPVRVQVQSEASQALRDRLQGGPRGVTAAPVAAVTAEALPAPGVRSVATRAVLDAATPAPEAAPAVPDRLPAVVRQGVARPGSLWIRAGRFSAPGYANVVRSKLSGLGVEVRREGSARQAEFVVRAGPYASVAAADAALDQARAAGVTDATIVVE